MASNNKDNRNKLLSAILTLLLGAGIVALLLFTSLHYHYPPLDGEKEMKLLQDSIVFGGEFVEMGDFEELLNDEPSALADASQEQESDNTEPQQVGQNDLTDNGSIDESPQQQVATKTQESPMKVQEQPKKLPAEKKTEQPKPTTQPQKQGEPKPQPATKKTEQPKPATPAAPSEADKRMNKAFGKANGSGDGKQGNPEGAQGAEKSVGKPGVGGL